jgi:hypothetical protein
MKDKRVEQPRIKYKKKAFFDAPFKTLTASLALTIVQELNEFFARGFPAARRER